MQLGHLHVRLDTWDIKARASWHPTTTATATTTTTRVTAWTTTTTMITTTTLIAPLHVQWKAYMRTCHGISTNASVQVVVHARLCRGPCQKKERKRWRTINEQSRVENTRKPLKNAGNTRCEFTKQSQQMGKSKEESNDWIREAKNCNWRELEILSKMETNEENASMQ